MITAYGRIIDCDLKLFVPAIADPTDTDRLPKCPGKNPYEI